MKALLVFVILHLATANLYPSQKTLKKVLVVFRHGDRSPVADVYPTDPNRNYDWKDGKGNLTTIGKTQALTLGKTLRLLYGGFLNTTNVNEAYARTSSIPRCIYSTICVLTGIYQQNKPTTCYEGFTPEQNDHMLNAEALLTFCKRIYMEILQNSSYRSYLEKNHDLLVQLENLTGLSLLKIPIKNLMALLELYDTLTVEKAHKLPIPSWVDSLFPAIQKLAITVYNLFSMTEESAKLQAGVLLNDIITQLKEPIATQKLYLYGTHDLIVLPALKLLRVSNDLPPPYTAAVIIELHEQKQLFGEISQCVQISYRNSTQQDSPHKMTIRDCPEECCPLGTFVRLTEKNAIQDREKECIPQSDTFLQHENMKNRLD